VQKAAATSNPLLIATPRFQDTASAWKVDLSTKYQYTCEPLECEEKDGTTVVTCHLVGNFPGSPVDLRFFFTLAGDKIASLEIFP
jgi:hypothetical protein